MPCKLHARREASRNVSTSLSLYELGKFKEALAKAELFSDSAEWPMGLRITGGEFKLTLSSLAYYYMGDQVRSDTLLQEYFEKFPGNNFWTAIVVARRDNADLAFEYLYKAMEKPENVPHRKRFPNIVDDPRWAALMEKLGRTPEQLAAIKFEYTPPAHAGQASP